MKNTPPNLEMKNILSMFVVRNQCITYGSLHLQVKEPKDKGAREFQKLISLPSLRDRLVSQRAPLFIHNQKLFKMRNQKRESNAIGVRQSASCTQPSKSLIEAAQLLSRAKQIISSYGQQNKDMHDCIYPDVLEIQSSLSIASIHIGNIVGYEFQEKFFYNQERSFA